MNKEYEVIVVGAGPAGSVLAYELAKAGIKVLVIEKEALPRFKCCAGGITYKTAQLLPININDVAEDMINGADVYFKDSGNFHGDWANDLIYTVSRHKFDYALVKKAEEAGAVILAGQPVVSVVENAQWVEVTTLANVFRSQFLVGADGAHSVVARGGGFKNNIDYITGISAEIMVNRKELARWMGRVTIDVGCIPGGYAWVFPKSDHISIGIATIQPGVKDLNHYYADFVKALHINDSMIISKRGGLISLCRGEPKVVMNRMVLVGDAAGLADPLSGEGIHHAVQSSLLLADTIKQCLVQGKSNLEDYQRAVTEQIMPEIKIARILQKMFIHFPQVVTKLLNFDARAWRGCCYFARGEIDYMKAKQFIGGFKGVREVLLKALERNRFKCENI